MGGGLSAVQFYCYQSLQDKRQQSQHERGEDSEGLDTLTVTPVIIHNIDLYRFPVTRADCNVYQNGEKRETDRERQRERQTDRQTDRDRKSDRARQSVCVCVCVCVRERERQTDRQTETETERGRERHKERERGLRQQPTFQHET